MKTRFRIMQAMLELISDHPYEQISVTMITKKVPIARQGFYKFYKGKEDLCRQMYIHFMTDAVVMDKEFTLYEFISHDLTEINRRLVFFYKLSWQPYEKDLFEILHDNIYRIYANMIVYQQKSMDEELDFLLDGYIIGCLHKLLDVLKKGEPFKVDQMTGLCIDMMPQPVRAILESGTYPASIITKYNE